MNAVFQGGCQVFKRQLDPVPVFIQYLYLITVLSGELENIVFLLLRPVEDVVVETLSLDKKHLQLFFLLLSK